MFSPGTSGLFFWQFLVSECLPLPAFHFICTVSAVVSLLWRCTAASILNDQDGQQLCSLRTERELWSDAETRAAWQTLKSVDEDAKVSSAPRIAHPPRYLEIRWGSTPAVVFPRAGKITFRGNTVPLRMSAKMLYRRL